MKLSALPAVSLSICSAIHPSSDLSTSGGGVRGGCQPPEAFRSALTGRQPASRKSARRRLAAAASASCQHAAHGPALRGCHTAARRAAPRLQGSTDPRLRERRANPPRCCPPPTQAPQPAWIRWALLASGQRQQIVAKKIKRRTRAVGKRVALSKQRRDNAG